MAKKKKKSQRSVALTYFITVLVFLLIIGSIAFYVLNKYILTDEDESSVVPQVVVDYEPKAEDCQTILFAGVDNNILNSLMLIRFQPTEEKIVCVAIPISTEAQVNTEKKQIKDLYTSGGIIKTVTAVENAYDLKVERYMKLSNEGFSNLVDSLGGATYTIPMDMSYKNEVTNEDTYYKGGDSYTLWGDDIRKLITYPLYPDGEEYNIKMASTIIATLINESISSSKSLLKNIDLIFNGVVNLSETNITAYDFRNKKNAINYIINNTTNPAMSKTPYGTWTDDGTFILDPKSQESIKNALFLTE